MLNSCERAREPRGVYTFLAGVFMLWLAGLYLLIIRK